MRSLGFVARVGVLALVAACSSSGSDGHVDGTGTIGAAGGTVSLTGGPSVQIPPGALSVNTAVALSTSTVQPPTGAITHVYQFGPEATTFGLPVLVSFPVPAGTKGTDVAIYWTKAGSTTEWEVLPTTVTGAVATAETTRFGAGFVGAACTAGVACAPANPCHSGAMTCNQGTPICSDTGASLPDGTICGGGDLCAAGTCGPSYAGPITLARTYRVTRASFAPFTQMDEVTRYAPPDVTRTVFNDDGSRNERDLTFVGRAVVMSRNVVYPANGTSVVNTYSPPQLVLPPSTTPGAKASSTSLVTAGATTYTMTRTLTVDGVETVIVPAGTFSALKVTSSIVLSSGFSSHVENWWAPGIGQVKALSYPDSNTLDTTLTELMRYSPMVCSGTACACNAIELAAPDVQPVYVAAALPAPQGGTLVTGTYQLTAEDEYTGLGGASGPTGETHREVFVLDVDAGTFQFASLHPGSAAGGDRGTVAFERSGSELIVTPVCGVGPPAGEHVGFTAAGAELRLLTPDSGSPTLGQEKILTRQ